MSRTCSFALAVMACGCGDSARPAPVLAVILDDTSTDALAALTLKAAHAWVAIGVDVAEPLDNAALIDCPERWFDDPAALPCNITVFIAFTPNAILGGEGGSTNHVDRTSNVASDLDPVATQSLISRELGFSIFDTADTLHLGDVGIMTAPSGGVLVPTAADVEFAQLHTDEWVR